VCDKYGIDKRSTSAYHPQTDGQTERFNRTLNDMLSQYVASNGKDWDEWIAPVLFAYRTSPHASTGISPYEMIFGRKPSLPIHLRVPVQLSNDHLRSPNEHLSIVKDSISRLHEIARDRLTVAHARQKEQHDKGASGKQFNVGDQIMLFNPAVKKGQCSKFKKLWSGPFIIERKSDPPCLNYLIRNVANNKIFFVHRNRMKLLPDRRSSEPEIVHVEEEQMENDGFEVDGPQVYQEGEGIVDNRQGEMGRGQHPKQAQHEDILEAEPEAEQLYEVGFAPDPPKPVVLPMQQQPEVEFAQPDLEVRRSARVRKPVDRLIDSCYGRLLPKNYGGGPRRKK